MLKDNPHEITLSRELKVNVLESADQAHRYYYLPATWELSMINNSPEIMFTLYEATNNKDVKGGLLHVLIQWGLTEGQEKKTQEILRQRDSLAVLAGAASIELNENIFHFLAGNPAADLLARSATTLPAKVSTLPGHKTALSFQLSSEDAAALLKMIQDKKEVAAKFESGYSFSVAVQKGFVRTSIQKDAVITGQVSGWLKALRDFGLIKFVSL